MTFRPYLTPAFLLVVPILALNIVFAARLPAAYQPAIFWADIPAPLALTENTLRIALFTLTAFLPLSAQWRGWALFVVGIGLYAASWAALIVAPVSGWATTWVGFTAPAWTPAFWLAGIGLACRAPRIAPRFPWKPIYWLLAAGFFAAHVSHVSLVWSRL